MSGSFRNASGEGSFKTNKNGTVTMRKTVGYHADGSRKVITVTKATKAACIKAMGEKTNEWIRDQERESMNSHTTIEEMCRQHLKYQTELKELKPTSIDRRESTIDNQIAKYPFGSLQASTATAKDIDDHINMLIKEGKLSDSSIDKTLDVINAAYKWAVARGELTYNPVLPVLDSLKKRITKLVSKQANELDVKILNAEERQAFINEAMSIVDSTGNFVHGTAGLCGIVLLETGMRSGELLALTWNDLDFEKGLLTINKNVTMTKNRNKETDKKYVLVEGSTKNQKARTIRLSKDALNAFRLIYTHSDHREGTDRIVLTRSGKPNTTTNLEKRIGHVYKCVGLGKEVSGLHIFRRTFATNMYEQGAGIKEIAGYIGDNEDTVERYYIAARKKVIEGNEAMAILVLPTDYKTIKVDE